MDNFFEGCECCPAAWYCERYGYDETKCDELLEKIIEKGRKEYYNGWDSYINDREDFLF